MSGKYKITSMQTIQKIKGTNGYNVVSTFSGCGGSCLGYEMAGYNVLYANEFVPEAQNTYRANHEGVYLDTRDIRQIKPEDILKITGLKKFELDLFDGSPPCSSFSMAGKRDKLWGEIKNYSDTKQRTDDLFFEYIRILKGLMPKVFVAENVKGLTQGRARGMFKIFMKEMENCGYNVTAQLINAMYLGVPQSRERCIFIGVRKDLKINPPKIKPLNDIVTIGMALEDVKNDDKEVKWLFEKGNKYSVTNDIKGIAKNPKKLIHSKRYFNSVRCSIYSPCPTICQSHGGLSVAGVFHPLYDRKFTIMELKRICSFPDDFVLTGNYSQKWERIGRAVPPLMMYHISRTIRIEVLDKCKKIK